MIAYKQPVTAAEIGEIRSVNTSGVLSTLLERHLIKIVGRKNVIGRPFLYGTTKEFLIRFGLNDLNDLPKIEDMAQQLGFEPPPVLMERPGAGRDAAARRGRRSVGRRTRWRTSVAGSSNSEQQRVDAVRVHELFTRRPLEDREAAVLRRDQRHRVALIVHELRRRQVPRPAQLRRRRARRRAAFDRLGHVDLLDRRAAAPPRDLRAERQQVVAVVDDAWRRPRRSGRRSHRRRASGHRGPAFFVAHQLRQFRVRRIDGVEHRRDDRFAPARRCPTARPAARRRAHAAASRPPAGSAPP